METDSPNDRPQVIPSADVNNLIEAMETNESESDIATWDQTQLNPETIDLPLPPTTNQSIQAGPSSSISQIQAMDEDEVRSEATFQFKVEKFSRLKDSLLSPPCYVRNLPWKIMVMPRPSMTNDRTETKSLGFFLQCNGDSESSSWSCNATAELRILSFKQDTVQPFVRKIKHVFYSKENDWGFSHFLSWSEIIDPEKGYIQDDTIILEVFVVAEAPHGVFWDSKKHTGYVGLKNQGATCYMNSLLQTLYFTNQLRKAVYKMPTEADDSSKSVALALQRVFHDLQYSDKPVGTKKLTKSFGWETLDSFMQHDVQEFLRVLLDKLESKMKATCVEGTVPKLFEGKMSSFIKCKNVDYASTRTETFYDIQLNIKGKKNIDESFRDYIATETLDGDNKYDAGMHGLQEAEKGVIFVSFPPVLHLHLMRFQYDPITDNSVKFNDRFEFYENINLDAYIQEKESTPADYTLHAVLVHSGDNHGGHYVVYINPLGDGKWCKFDDDVVSRCSKLEAINHNYGGNDDDLSYNVKHCSNAYMLVYIRNSELSTVLQEITDIDIPSELLERLSEEKRMEQVRRRERADSNSYMTVNVLLEDYFISHQTIDLFDLEKAQYRVFRIRKTATIHELLMQHFIEAFKVPIEKIRLWPLAQRHNHITRPAMFDYREELTKSVHACAELQNPWIVFLEILPADSPLDLLQPFDKERDVLLFFKNYDPQQKRLNYCGLGYYNLTSPLSSIVPELNVRAGYPNVEELTLYEERGTSIVEKLPYQTGLSIEKIMRDVMDGDIIIFEKTIKNENYELATCEDYFRDLLYRVDVTFIDKANPHDTGFTLELSQRMTYDQMASAVGQRINIDPYNIQFFKCQNYKDIPGIPLRCSFDGSLKDLLVYSKPKGIKKIFYQQLTMNINELESKKQFKCIWINSSNLKDEKELILYPNKNGTVKTLLEEAAKQIQFNIDGTKKLRISEIFNNKIVPGPHIDTSLEFLQTSIGITSASSACINSGTPSQLNQSNSTDTAIVSGCNTPNQIQQQQKIYRIEEIPREELNISDNELLIPVTHFYKDVYSTFGVPFFIKICNGELFENVKNRIQKRICVPDKEFSKYKFAIITGNRIDFIHDEFVNINDFRATGNQASKPYLGLEHLNKSHKRSRFNYLEKAIKIYN